MEAVEYWKQRCELAEAYIEESPCDPDIYAEQWQAYDAWQEFKKLNTTLVGNRRELLIAFADWYKTTDFNCEGCCGSDCVDEYLKSN
jgi:hypothetical protein